MVNCVQEPTDFVELEASIYDEAETFLNVDEGGSSCGIMLDLAGLRTLAAEIEARIAEVVALGGEG